MKVSEVNDLIANVFLGGQVRYQLRGVLQKVRDAQKQVGYYDYQTKQNWNAAVFDDKYDFQGFHLIDSDMYRTAKDGVGYDGILSKRTLVIAAKRQHYIDAALNELQKKWNKIELVSLELDALTVWERFFLMPAPHPHDWIAVAVSYSIVERATTNYCGGYCFDSDASRECGG